VTKAGWIRVTREDGAHLRIRVDAVDSYLPNGRGGALLFLRGGQRVEVDFDVTEALDTALGLAENSWKDLPASAAQS